jgi:hypothetical protein
MAAAASLLHAGAHCRAVPLAGHAVKVTNGYFLIGLSAVDVDKRRGPRAAIS